MNEDLIKLIWGTLPKKDGADYEQFKTELTNDKNFRYQVYDMYKNTKEGFDGEIPTNDEIDAFIGFNSKTYDPKATYENFGALNKAVIKTNAEFESGNRNLAYGGKEVPEGQVGHSGESHGETALGPTSAEGYLQFQKKTWEDIAKKYELDPNDFSEENQYVAGMYLMEEDFSRRSGGKKLGEALEKRDFGSIINYLGGEGKNTTFQALQGVSPEDYAKVFDKHYNSFVEQQKALETGRVEGTPIEELKQSINNLNDGFSKLKAITSNYKGAGDMDTISTSINAAIEDRVSFETKAKKMIEDRNSALSQEFQQSQIAKELEANASAKLTEGTKKLEDAYLNSIEYRALYERLQNELNRGGIEQDAAEKILNDNINENLVQTPEYQSIKEKVDEEYNTQTQKAFSAYVKNDPYLKEVRNQYEQYAVKANNFLQERYNDLQGIGLVELQSKKGDPYKYYLNSKTNQILTINKEGKPVPVKVGSEAEKEIQSRQRVDEPGQQLNLLGPTRPGVNRGGAFRRGTVQDQLQEEIASHPKTKQAKAMELDLGDNWFAKSIAGAVEGTLDFIGNAVESVVELDPSIVGMNKFAGLLYVNKVKKNSKAKLEREAVKETYAKVSAPIKPITFETQEREDRALGVKTVDVPRITANKLRGHEDTLYAVYNNKRDVLLSNEEKTVWDNYIMTGELAQEDMTPAIQELGKYFNNYLGQKKENQKHVSRYLTLGEDINEIILEGKDNELDRDAIQLKVAERIKDDKTLSDTEKKLLTESTNRDSYLSYLDGVLPSSIMGSGKKLFGTVKTGYDVIKSLLNVDEDMTSKEARVKATLDGVNKDVWNKVEDAYLSAGTMGTGPAFEYTVTNNGNKFATVDGKIIGKRNSNESFVPYNKLSQEEQSFVVGYNSGEVKAPLEVNFRGTSAFRQVAQVATDVASASAASGGKVAGFVASNTFLYYGDMVKANLEANPNMSLDKAGAIGLAQSLAVSSLETLFGPESRLGKLFTGAEKIAARELVTESIRREIIEKGAKNFIQNGGVLRNINKSLRVMGKETIEEIPQETIFEDLATNTISIIAGEKRQEQSQEEFMNTLLVTAASTPLISSPNAFSTWRNSNNLVQDESFAVIAENLDLYDEVAEGIIAKSDNKDLARANYQAVRDLANKYSQARITSSELVDVVAPVTITAAQELNDKIINLQNQANTTQSDAKKKALEKKIKDFEFIYENVIDVATTGNPTTIKDGSIVNHKGEAYVAKQEKTETGKQVVLTPVFGGEEITLSGFDKISDKYKNKATKKEEPIPTPTEGEKVSKTAIQQAETGDLGARKTELEGILASDSASMQETGTRMLNDRTAVQAELDDINKQLGKDGIDSFVAELGVEMTQSLALGDIDTRMNNAEYIQEKELNDRSNKLYELWDTVDGDKRLTPDQKESIKSKLETQIQKLEQYELATADGVSETTTRTTAQGTRVIGRTSRKSPSKYEVTPERFEGKETVVTKKDGTTTKSTWKVAGEGTVQVVDEKGGIVPVTDGYTFRETTKDDNGTVVGAVMEDKATGTTFTVNDPELALDIAIKAKELALGPVEDAVFEQVILEVTTKSEPVLTREPKPKAAPKLNTLSNVQLNDSKGNPLPAKTYTKNEDGSWSYQTTKKDGTLSKPLTAAKALTPQLNQLLNEKESSSKTSAKGQTNNGEEGQVDSTLDQEGEVGTAPKGLNDTKTILQTLGTTKKKIVNQIKKFFTDTIEGITPEQSTKLAEANYTMWEAAAKTLGKKEGIDKAINYMRSKVAQIGVISTVEEARTMGDARFQVNESTSDDRMIELLEGLGVIKKVKC